jgi:hypothetical protein
MDEKLRGYPYLSPIFASFSTFEKVKPFFFASSYLRSFRANVLLFV